MAGVVRTTPQGLLQITPERELKRSTAKQIHLRVEGEHERGLTGRYRFVTKCLPNGEVVARLVAAIDSLEPSTHPTPEVLDWLERRATYSSVYVNQQHPGRSDHHRRLPRLEEGWAFLRSDQGRAADTLLAPRLEEAFEWLELAGRSGSSAKVVVPLHEFTSIAAPECSNKGLCESEVFEEGLLLQIRAATTRAVRLDPGSGHVAYTQNDFRWGIGSFQPELKGRDTRWLGSGPLLDNLERCHILAVPDINPTTREEVRPVRDILGDHETLVLPEYTFTSKGHTVIGVQGLGDTAEASLRSHVEARKDLLMEDIDWLHGKKDGLSVFFGKPMSFADASSGLFGRRFPVGPRHLRARTHEGLTLSQQMALVEAYNENERQNRITGVFDHKKGELHRPLDQEGGAGDGGGLRLSQEVVPSQP